MMKENRHLERALAFFSVVAPFFNSYFHQPYHLIEFCAGNGNGARIFYARGKARQVTFVDTRIVRGLERTLEHMQANYSVETQGVENYAIPENAAIMAIHACNRLTDIIVEKAVNTRAPIAVMPCCYNDQMKKYQLEQPPDSRLLLYSRPEEYYDATRMQFLKENGYKVQLQKIDHRITSMNNVILGMPH